MSESQNVSWMRNARAIHPCEQTYLRPRGFKTAFGSYNGFFSVGTGAFVALRHFNIAV
jgi:hypothetical protein